jgi:hypothetical protein
MHSMVPSDATHIVKDVVDVRMAQSKVSGLSLRGLFVLEYKRHRQLDVESGRPNQPKHPMRSASFGAKRRNKDVRIQDDRRLHDGIICDTMTLCHRILRDA